MPLGEGEHGRGTGLDCRVLFMEARQPDAPECRATLGAHSAQVTRETLDGRPRTLANGTTGDS
jgi:hypothetical protein